MERRKMGLKSFRKLVKEQEDNHLAFGENCFKYFTSNQYQAYSEDKLENLSNANSYLKTNHQFSPTEYFYNNLPSLKDLALNSLDFIEATLTQIEPALESEDLEKNYYLNNVKQTILHAMDITSL